MGQATRKIDDGYDDANQQERHPLFYMFGILGFCTFLAIGYFFQLINDPEKFLIEKIAVDGEFLNLKPAEVETLVSNAVVGGFFSLDVDKLRETILNNAWVASVAVRRIWPDSIRVSIREQDPIAYWGDHALLNSEADIFAPEEISRTQTMVRLDGPIGTEGAVLEGYTLMKSQIESLGIKIKSVRMTERRAWTVNTADNVTIHLGRDDIDEKVARFRSAYKGALKDDWSHIERVDLRYTNGLTVKKTAASGNNALDTQS